MSSEVFLDGFYGESDDSHSILWSIQPEMIGEFRVEGVGGIPVGQMNYAIGAIQKLTGVKHIGWNYYDDRQHNYSVIYILTVSEPELVDAVCREAFAGYVCAARLSKI
jgi:hypothetical protein